MTRPPIVELVIGVQFDPLAGLSNGHLGRFWAEVAGEYPEVSDAPPIAPVVESFTDDVEFGAPMIAVLPTRGDSRLRMASEAGYMVQVQNGWFVTNWIKRGDARYPGFAAVRGVFDRELVRFSSHLASAGLGALVPNMWEVTYIDHVAKGELWRGGQDTSRVLPGLLSAPRIDGGECEAVSGAWSFRLSRCRGRLAVTVQTVRVDATDEVLRITSTARGPVEPGRSFSEGIDEGHRVAVEALISLSSDEARAYWMGGST